MKRVELIAECSSNHGGDLFLATEFVHAFAEAGADFVKFQTTRVAHLNPADPQYDWFRTSELSENAHHVLKAACEQAGTTFLTTVYHPAEVPFLASLGLAAIKIGSGESADMALAAAVCGAGFPRIFVALGLVEQEGLFRSPYLRWRRELGGGYNDLTFFRCRTRYPCPPYFAHGTYTPPLAGWSDHCIGLDGCRTAIMDGATIIEKHVCLPRQARPVKAFEASVAEFRELRQFADDTPERFLGRWKYA